jgi:hypothetical protein
MMVDGNTQLAASGTASSELAQILGEISQKKQND